MNTENHDKSTARDAAHHEIVQSLIGLGAEWAALGLSFGTQALERSAKSLTLAAKTLETITRTLEKKAAPEARDASDAHPAEVVEAADPQPADEQP
jgi:hypothetical protein